MESTKDCLGVEVVVGDRVIFAEGGHFKFRMGYVKKITGKGVGINPDFGIWGSGNLCCWYRTSSDFVKDTSCK